MSNMKEVARATELAEEHVVIADLLLGLDESLKFRQPVLSAIFLDNRLSLPTQATGSKSGVAKVKQEKHLADGRKVRLRVFSGTAHHGGRRRSGSSSPSPPRVVSSKVPAKSLAYAADPVVRSPVVRHPLSRGVALSPGSPVSRCGASTSVLPFLP